MFPHAKQLNCTLFNEQLNTVMSAEWKCTAKSFLNLALGV